jgi:FixJ family two-component response regulator
MVTRSLVSIDDDDESVRESLPDLLRQLGCTAQALSSAAFLASQSLGETCCLILDIAMPGNGARNADSGTEMKEGANV